MSSWCALEEEGLVKPMGSCTLVGVSQWESGVIGSKHELDSTRLDDCWEHLKHGFG